MSFLEGLPNFSQLRSVFKVLETVPGYIGWQGAASHNLAAVHTTPSSVNTMITVTLPLKIKVTISPLSVLHCHYCVSPLT